VSKTIAPWDAKSWDELQKVASLDEVKKALWAREKNREYHKVAYLKRQTILQKAKEQGITA
jgi:ribosomal protein L32E